MADLVGINVSMDIVTSVAVGLRKALSLLAAFQASERSLTCGLQNVLDVTTGQ